VIIIPAIDLMDGRCVRLIRGDFEASTAYGDEPAEIAAFFERQGIERLHVVDLDGAKSGSATHHDVLRTIRQRTNLLIDFGGGLRSREAVEAALDAGADMLSVGSIAVRQPEELAGWVSEFGSERFIFAADVRDGLVAVSGWTETTTIPIEEAISRVLEVGIGAVLATDISVDGTMEGPATPLYSGLRARFPDVYLIASGGVGSEDDIRALDRTGVDAVIVGKALYEGRIRLSEFV
jgi:phosphoribosylformimino-5-aminoimidazole carboxamide ribotide isomerase